MGGFDEWRNFLLYLFQKEECFYAELEDGKEFCISIVDVMQYLAGVVTSQKMGMTKTGFMKEYFDVAYVTKKIDEAVANHINYQNDCKCPIITRATVFMLDTVHNVPRNKSSKQKARDQSDLTHMDERSFHRMHALSRQKRHDNLFILDSHQQERYPLDGNTVWRSVNLKLQLYRLVTHHILHASVKPGTVLVMDDGLAFSTKDYERVRREIVYDLQIGERGEFEKEFIINQIMTHSKDFISRFLVFDDGVFCRRPSTGIGEADIKILSYIQRDIGLKKFLIVNQDTDIIFILLLHMKSFLKGDESDDEYEVWLDTRSPNFSQSIKSYRFINIKRLYYALKKFFQEEFPLIKYPIETFCFLVFSQETDFTRKFSPSLQINPAFLWNWFAQLHTGKPDYIPFCEKPSPKKRVTFIKGNKIAGLLNAAVQYDMIKRRYLLKHNAIARFYYFLCQMKLLDIRKEIGLSNGYYVRGEDCIVSIDELLIYGKEVQERVDLHRQYEAEKGEESEKFFQLAKRPAAATAQEYRGGEKKFKLSSSLVKKKQASVLISIVEDGENDEPVPLVVGGETESAGKKRPINSQMKSYLVRNEKKLKLLAKKESVNEYFGILPENDMLCRIYRIEWYISYCNDGWRNLLSCTETAKQDSSLSLWGWKVRMIEDEEEFQRVMNSSYYHAEYNPKKPHLYQLSEILETNQVSHKRYYF